jgi:hypothetical protein
MYSYTYSIPGQPITVTVSVDPTDMTKRYVYLISDDYTDFPISSTTSTNIVLANISAGEVYDIQSSFKIAYQDAEDLGSVEAVLKIDDENQTNLVSWSIAPSLEFGEPNSNATYAHRKEVLQMTEWGGIHSATGQAQSSGSLYYRFYAQNLDGTAFVNANIDMGKIVVTIYTPEEFSILNA